MISIRLLQPIMLYTRCFFIWDVDNNYQFTENFQQETYSTLSQKVEMRLENFKTLAAIFQYGIHNLF